MMLGLRMRATRTVEKYLRALGGLCRVVCLSGREEKVPLHASQTGRSSPQTNGNGIKKSRPDSTAKAAVCPIVRGV